MTPQHPYVNQGAWAPLEDWGRAWATVYVCGDLGHCSGCPDNQHCLAGKPRRAEAQPQETKKPSGQAGVSPEDSWSCPTSHPIKGNFTTYSGVGGRGGGIAEWRGSRENSRAEKHHERRHVPALAASGDRLTGSVTVRA
jgi:hypothetical protein